MIENNDPDRLLDFERYDIKGPRNDQQRIVTAWNRSIENCKSQFEYTMNRSINLEIMKKYGSQQWKQHNIQLTNSEKYLNDNLKEIQTNIDDINRKRKNMQLNAGRELNSLENEWWTFVNKNNQIELECALLQRKLDERRQQ